MLSVHLKIYHYLLLYNSLEKRKKDTPEELEAKKRSRQSRDQEVAESSKSAQTRVIRDETINQRIYRIFGGQYEYYSIKIPLKSVIRPGYSDTFINKVKIISAFNREVIFKAQLFVNYYIITNCLTTIPNEIFTQNFWYSICMLIFGNLSSQELQAKYSSVLNLAHAFDQYFQDYPLSIRPLAGLKGYSQCLSAACITVATTYNNYYVENYEEKLIQYLFFKVVTRFPSLKKGLVRKVVEEYLINLITLEKEPNLNVYDEIEDLNTRNEMIAATQDPTFINEVKALLPQDLSPQNPLSKARVSNSPGLIVRLWRQTLNDYENYRARCTVTNAQEIVEASEKVSSISLILLQYTKSALAAGETSVKASEAVVSAAESVITVAQDTAHHFPSDSKRTCVRLLTGSAMTFNAQAYNTSSTAATINSCSAILYNAIQEMLDLVNHYHVSSSATKELINDMVAYTRRLQTYSMQVTTSTEQFAGSAQEISTLASSINNTLESFLEDSKGMLNHAKDRVQNAYNMISTIEEVSNAAERIGLFSQDLQESTKNDMLQFDETETDPDFRVNKAYSPKVFSLFPMPGLKWRYVKIDSQNIHIFASKARMSDTFTQNYSRGLHHFFDVFNLDKLDNMNIKR